MTRRWCIDGWALSVCVALVAACGSPASDQVLLRLPQRLERPLRAADIRYDPTDNVASARLGTQGWLAIERRSDARALRVSIAGLCPVTVPAGRHAQPIAVRPIIDLGPARAPVGFDTAFSIRVQHGCPQQARGRITWRQLEGPRLTQLSVAHDGFELRARTPRFDTVHPRPPARGIVPISPRTQGRIVLEARWQGPGFAAQRHTIAIRATSRATGLSSVAVAQQLLIAGAGFRVARAPQGGRAQAYDSGELSVFTPDAPGRWTLARGGETVGLQAFWYDKTPYDCGRSECHAQIARTVVDSPMSHALERQLGQRPPAAVGCLLDCHVVGESGLRDGGFLDVASELRFVWRRGTGWLELPQALRRLGGVRCTACHGPGAIPQPAGRERVLRSDVCAICHDAPPRYVHVAQWRASRMARSDAAEGTRQGHCARCHTTAGFLQRVAGRASRPEPAEAEPTGIACAACHSPHASHSAARLLRRVPDEALPNFARGRSLSPLAALCVSCHAPQPDEARPSASSAAIWLGRARVPALGGQGLQDVRGPTPHGAIPRGCVGCHGASLAAKSGATEHSFRVSSQVCRPCHTESGFAARVQTIREGLRSRASSLARRLASVCGRPSADDSGAPSHAVTAAACPSRALARADYEVRLVLEDPAAGVHNGAFARQLLDDAARQLGF